MIFLQFNAAAEVVDGGRVGRATEGVFTTYNDFSGIF